MKLLPYRRACPVGIEIRSSEIRLARLERLARGNYRLVCADIGRLPSGPQAVVDWTALRELLGKMVRTLGLRGWSAVVSLPASGVRMQRMPQPVNLPSYAIEAAVQGKLRQEMFGAAGSFCIDYAELMTETAMEKEIYYVASRQELLAQHVECAASAGLEVKIVDIDVYALQRAACHLFAKPEMRYHVIALLMNMTESVEWIIYDKQTILLHQSIGKEEIVPLAQLVRAGISKFAALYPQHVIQRVIISGEVNPITVSDAAGSCGVVIAQVDSALQKQLTSSVHRMTDDDAQRLLTACGLSMRELPPWC